MEVIFDSQLVNAELIDGKLSFVCPEGTPGSTVEVYCAQEPEKRALFTFAEGEDNTDEQEIANDGIMRLVLLILPFYHMISSSQTNGGNLHLFDCWKSCGKKERSIALNILFLTSEDLHLLKITADDLTFDAAQLILLDMLRKKAPATDLAYLIVFSTLAYRSDSNTSFIALLLQWETCSWCVE